MKSWVEGRVVGQRRWTDSLYSIQVEATVAAFTAGQFTRLALEIDGEIIARPYSFVNGPDDPVHEFYYIIVPDGPLTHRLAELEAGDTVLIAPRAAGFFVLGEVPDAASLWMLSTGTAIGPFLSILATGEVWQRFEKVVLVHAVRLAAELSYQEKISALLEQHPGKMQYLPFVSREDTDFAIRGRVTDAIGSGQLEERAGMKISPGTSQVMICGNPSMVHDTQAILETRGLKRTSAGTRDTSPPSSTGRNRGEYEQGRHTGSACTDPQHGDAGENLRIIHNYRFTVSPRADLMARTGI